MEQILEKWYEFFDKERLNKWIDENKKNFQIILQHINTFETNKNNKISKYKDHIIEYAKNNIFRFTVICSSISIFITIVLIKIMEVFVK